MFLQCSQDQKSSRNTRTYLKIQQHADIIQKLLPPSSLRKYASQTAQLPQANGFHDFDSFVHEVKFIFCLFKVIAKWLWAWTTKDSNELRTSVCAH